MNAWRIYRLPGSRQYWHIDAGQGTQVFSVLALEFNVKTKTVDIGCGFPRAWLEISSESAELHIIDGCAVFSYKQMNLPFPSARCAGNKIVDAVGKDAIDDAADITNLMPRPHIE